MQARLDAVLGDCRAVKASCRALEGCFVGEGAGLVGDPAGGLLHLHVSVALVIAEGALRRTGGDLVEVRRSKTQELRVVVRKEASRQQGIVREVDARRDVRRTVGDLFGLGDKVGRPDADHARSEASRADTTQSQAAA
jgi:hypothetical protein